MINNLRYADDIVLIATANTLQKVIDKVDLVLREFGFKMGTRKIKVMQGAKKTIRINITCHGQSLEQVETFRYLGTLITQDSDCSSEIRAGLGMGRAAV